MDRHLVIRSAGDDERSSIERLEALDDRRLGEGDVLVAEVDGEPWAAVAIGTGDGVADPFRPSGEVLVALQATARSLRTANGRRAGHARGVRHLRRRYLMRGGAGALQRVHRAAA